MENESEAAAVRAETQQTFDAMARVLRDRGCRCPLMWNGVVPVPATICDLQPAGVRECKVLAALPAVPEAPALDTSTPASGD